MSSSHAACPIASPFFAHGVIEVYQICSSVIVTCNRGKSACFVFSVSMVPLSSLQSVSVCFPHFSSHKTAHVAVQTRPTYKFVRNRRSRVSNTYCNVFKYCSVAIVPS